MAKLLGLDKVATLFRTVRDHGGIIGSIKTLFRVDELKSGTLVGEDKYGNRYYENNMYFVGELLSTLVWHCKSNSMSHHHETKDRTLAATTVINLEQQ
ncbi:probable NADH dehydrogenase [ubiquinone] 1 alpha subcomplex subunit 12 [Temnothorax curvispinosus]|uniref:Probable NADH dehydrogenase [ubiquinone] 1 alpha subcomplex subunit 12 n=1 Tax=Temnothorax curvispinosus TaxID=300111 RepID=A0A6J1RDR3_9HYME|nr:probable NADH dehydrogenase [ubiquinone] 1 alpha subcomplex subunit 12 [Temnothorax curvispinosus]